jgi:hypothetical protein
MHWILLRLAAFALTCLAVADLGSDASALLQAPATAQASRVESGLTVTCEVFCSSTKVRTANARIRWSLTKAGLDASRVTNLAAAKQSLEATIYKNGFEKGLSITLPIAAATPLRSIEPVITQPAQARLRAYQIRLIEIEPPKAEVSDAAGSEMGAVVENLEPGVNYIWRIAIDTPGGRIVSAATRCQAPVCPVDVPLPTRPHGSR